VLILNNLSANYGQNLRDAGLISLFEVIFFAFPAILGPFWGLFYFFTPINPSIKLLCESFKFFSFDILRLF